MCLFYTEIDEKFLKKLRKAGKPIVAYKVLFRDQDGVLVSPIHSSYYASNRKTMWRPSRVSKSTRTLMDITEEEKRLVEYDDYRSVGLIERGFHCFRNRASAREYRTRVDVLMWPGQSGQIRKVLIQPNDLVMVGSNESGKEAFAMKKPGNCVVATKVRLLSKVH